ncbi:hypothetical protein FOMPIDRAFT_1038644 [Fomitopsis schrenkii]|uniref:PARP-type domain-containing protein n=1 Tax=Fomitopsis schrenkii TaxID=2126942 RepID=S8DV25_FOMSC|nr:hypothetical protein FOMPIDRAFT_1038644 [Fomitopsis schrenkii]
MSDEEGGKKSGYRLEYANSGRSKCNGPKPCKGTPIGKGELRFGSLVDFRGNTSFSWRHWGCVTTKILSNMKNSFDEADELDGFEDLNDDDQEKIRKAWGEGKVADEDIPDTARKADGEDDEEEEEEKPKAKKGGKKKADAEKDGDGGKGVFKLEYASSARAKCKICGEGVGKGFFRLGQEVDFRGHKATNWHHFGCATPKQITSLKASYSTPSEVDGFSGLKSAEQDKVKRAWEAGEVPDDDKGAGEAVETAKKAPAKRKKDEDGEEKPKRGRAKKAKDDDDDEEEKPKRKRAAPTEKKAKAPAKRSKKKAASDDDSGEDFGDEIAAVGRDDDEEDEEEEEPAPKKRKTAPASKGKPASKAKPAPKAKPASSRGRKKVQESDIDEEDD